MPDIEPRVHWLERLLTAYVDEPALWPVLFAIVGHLAVLIALPLLQVIRSGSLLSMAVLVVLAAPSLAAVRWEWRKKGRPGSGSFVVLLTWLTGLGMAWLGDTYNIL